MRSQALALVQHQLKNNMFFLKSKKQRLIVQVVTVIFVFNLLLIPLYHAQAQMVFTDPITGQAVTIKNIKDFITKILVGTAAVSLINAGNYFAQKLAYDAAVALATGGKGEMPLFSTKGWGDYFKDVSLNAVGEFVGSLSENFEDLDLCNPGPAGLRVRIQSGLVKPYIPVGEGPEPKCTWNEISDNWDEFTEEFTTGEVLSRTGVMFETGQSPLGITLEAGRKLSYQAYEAKQISELERLEGEGFLAKTGIISGEIQTPAQVIAEEGRTTAERGRRAQEQTSSQTSQALAAGATQILASALGTFVNTLAGKLLERVFNKGLFSLADLRKKKSGGALINPEFALVGTREVAQEIYSDLVTPPIKQTDVYDLITVFATCPSQFIGQENCVIDQSFETAIRREATGSPLSVKEAIDEGLLHGDWPLISSYDRARNADVYCHTYGYCYSNLIKLRQARIIPIGWEIAAQKSGVVAGQATLREVMNGFYDCGVDGDGNPIADDDHPWCHLIDPNWIIKYPLTQCRASVYGPTLLTAENSLRTEICVDAPTCIAVDDEGNCVGGWGYCTREKNTWHFDGDQCPAVFESCLTFEDREGNANSYLLNTVNYSVCNTDNAGCRWYAREPLGEDDWDVTVSYDDENYSLIATDGAIYFDKDVRECSEADAGCTEMIRASEAGVTLNTLANPSFESASPTDPGFPDGWEEISGGVVTYDTTGDDSYEGIGAIMPGSFGVKQEVILNPSRFYTFSLFAKNSDGASFDAEVRVMKSDRTFADLADYYMTGVNCTKTGALIGPPFAISLEGITPPEDYARYYCTFTTPGASESPDGYFIGEVILRGYGGTAGDTWIDAVQLEESEVPTLFHEGIAAGGEVIYLRKPPASLGCTGSDGDPEECGEYLPVCSPLDVGCKRFYPVDGGPSLTAITTSEDICPAQCVGYATFREEPTQWTSTAQFPMFFIPETGLECTASVVGCDTFTNLDAPELGGESTNYFTEIRSCQLPAEDSETFYTWEGSDTTGFQLKTWVLKASDQDDGPCTTKAPDGTCDDPSPGTPEFAARDCSDVFEIDADCREFFNTAGDVFYRYYSDTIISTDECYRYRKDENTGQTDCEDSGGLWTDTGECIYMGYPAESLVCPSSAAGCRAYTGATSRNVEQEFYEDFEGVTADWSGGSISTESVIMDGHSFKVLSGDSLSKAWDIEQGETYLMSFWAKGQGDVIVSVDGTRLGTVTLSAEWNSYEVGPILIEGTLPESPTITLSGFTQDSYIDNVDLQRVSDHIYIIRDSWYTPLVCDQNNQGVYLPQAQLGCQEYTDDLDNTHYLKSFNRLCNENAVGCEGMIDTYNSTSPATEVYNEGEGGAEVIVPGDTVSYYVYDETYACTADAKGCEAMGRPVVSQDGLSVVDWEDVYLINNPNDYDNTLCLTEEAFCDEFQAETGTYYFKDPGNKTCEFKEKVTIAGIEYNGWFISGTEMPCYPGFLGGGNIYGIWRNGDEDYDAWYGECPYQYNLCTKFVDPSNTSDVYPQGQEYYYLNNDQLDQSCTTVSKGEGCALFNNVSNPTKQYNTWATYLTSQDNNFEGVSPIDCRTSDSPYCNNICQYTLGTGLGGDIDLIYTHSCRDSSDCRDFTGLGSLSMTSCVDISSMEMNCRKWQDGLNVYEWGRDCSTSDCPSGWECVDTKQALHQNDTNTIIKVRRDRECGEWLSCRSSVSVWDDEAFKYKNVCTNLGLCNEYAQVGDAGECTNFIESEHTGDILSEVLYSKRDVSWDGLDYSGFAIPNYYSVDEIEPIDLSNLTGATTPDLRLGYVDGDCTTLYAECGDPNSLGNRGVCVPAIGCIYSINGESLPIATNADELYSLLNNEENQYRLVGPSCRAYPEETSPFPSKVGDWENGRMTTINANFKRANVCEETVWRDLNGDNIRDENELSYQDCECSYQKATYGNGAVTKFYSSDETNIPKGICLNGPRAGQPCIPNVEYDENQSADSEHNLQACGSIRQGGSCQPLERTDQFVGWEGQCLEYDLRTTLNGDPEENACSNWYPSYILSGGQDIYNIYPSAGYNPSNTGRYWCLLGRGLRTPVGEEEIGDNYEVITRDADKMVSTGDNNDREYWERFYPAETTEQYYKDDIIAIEVKPVKAQAGDWPNGRNSHTEDFYKDGGHILSRQNEVNLEFGYTSWEVSWNLPEDMEFPSEAPPVFIDSSYAYAYTEYTRGRPTHHCDNDYDPNNYFAIRAIFLPDGRFKGFWTVSCDDSSSSGWVKFDMVFHLADSCLVVAQAVDEEGNNKAYTDRLYQASNYALTVGSEYFYDQPFAPFGSAQSYEAPLTPIARDVRVEPWMIGDGMGDESHIGSPDLSLLPEKYSLAGSSLGCLGTCADEAFGDINFQPNISRPMDVLGDLFTRVYNLYAWFSGNEELECVPSTGWTGTARYYLPCGEEGATCGRVGSCTTSLACTSGPFKGEHDCSTAGFCTGEAGYCDSVTDEDGETANICVDSFREEEACDSVATPGALGRDYTSKAGTTVPVPSGTMDVGSDFCKSTGFCINWAAHTGGTEEWKCYGGVNHDVSCTSDDNCNMNAVDGTDCENGLCTGGVYSSLGHRVACDELNDCRVSISTCSAEDVLRYSGGEVLNGGVCGGEYGDYSSQTLTCERSEFSGVSARGFISKGCGGDENFPCLTTDDCETGTCDWITSVHYDFGDAIDDDVAGDTGNPPTIAAIDFGDCDQVTGTCAPARINAFDVNNWYFGVVTGQEQLKTTIRFYAWADHDQMPITGRTIDWGDGSPIDRTTTSKYKNHKPYCGDDVYECSNYEGLTCNDIGDCPGGTGSCQPTDALHFGNDEDACTQGYFQFEHTYLCDGTEDLPRCSFDTSPGITYDAIPSTGCRTETACFYRPRVQVMDNWGWCNGDCRTGGGCYRDGSVDQCKIESETIPHWTYFDGYIKVNK